MNLLDYLQHHLLSRAGVLRAAAIDDATLFELQQRGVAPLPSYRLEVDIACHSFFGAHGERAHLEYYASGCPAWIASICHGRQPPREMFDSRYRARLAALREDGLGCAHVKFDTGLDQHLDAEWSSFIDGTYGLCTRGGLPEDIAAKELAATIVEELTQASAPHAIAPDDRVRLQRAVDLLDAASSPFAPHEVARSSRRRLVDGVRAAYFP